MASPEYIEFFESGSLLRIMESQSGDSSKGSKIVENNSTGAIGALEDRAASATDRLCARVKLLRAERGWTLEQLATESGVSRAMLSQIERGQANPTFAVAYRIAGSLGLSRAELVEEPEVETIEVIRADDSAYQFRDEGDCQIRGLLPRHLEKEVEFYELRLRPGNSLESAAHLKETREFLTVQAGELEVISGESRARLAEGDSAYYPADVKHTIVNVGDADATAFLVAVYRGRLSKS